MAAATPITSDTVVIVQLTIGQLEAMMTRIVERHLDKTPKPTDVWLTEADALAKMGICKKTLRRRIKAGKIKPDHLRPNPLSEGLLIHAKALNLL